MSILFEPCRIGDLEIRNRFVRSATTSAYADKNGVVRDAAIDLYSNLAKGDVGLIIKGHLYVLESGKAHEGMAGISDEEHVTRLHELTDAVHEHGGKIAAQLNHAGIYHEKDRAGPSEYEGNGWKARALTEDEILDIIQAFGDAAERAAKAGFDAIQIHGAHGYLISQFLSRLTNRRQDKWGGNLQKRMRFLLRVYDEVREQVKDAPVLLKLNCDDFSENGFTIEDSKVVASTMAERGLDMLEISGNGVGKKKQFESRASHEDPIFANLPFAGYAAEIRETVKPMPLSVVNGFRERKTMEQAIEQGLSDLISMSRPFIREPDLVRKIKHGQEEVECIRCDACLGEDVFGKMMLRCHQG
ncbi:MAG: NADH:flavin oxidoreductase [Candidatus Lokiarchaeota archaeon]|nr:NADH:flavin oxidoreductase [Candidatus Lokiarchaeota archaeon]